MNREQITAQHRSRFAYVYIRQSTAHQVAHHLESQRRQRALVERACELGWPAELVVQVDEDLGISASGSQHRLGFHDMVAQVALNKIGIILAIEVSRLSRSNRDWYHLLDICAVTCTLIGDAEGLYDPRAYNDRLLLGLKGTMSEAELHLMKQRLVEAMREKAKRGEFRFRLPPGFIWDEAGRIQKSPDEQVVSTLELVFGRFDQLGTVHQTQCSLCEENRLVPVMGGRRQLSWKLPSYAYVHRILTNPMYAGAYAYGQRQTEQRLDESLLPVKRIRKRAREQWHALIQDHHEGFISWERFERNQRRIVDNRRGEPQAGAAREGESLLQGLVLCGRCGRRMKVGYGKTSSWRYRCVRQREQRGAPACQSFGAIRLERAVASLVLECLKPAGVEAMLEAARTYAESNATEINRWQQRVERQRYEAELAHRQYEAVDPGNRLVARELERRWEKALEALESIEAQVKAHVQVLEQPLGSTEEEQLRHYARNLPSLWSASTTRSQDRKRIVRCLIQNVVVTVPKEGSTLKGEIHWSGGEVTTIEVPKGKSGINRYVSDPELIELIRELSQEFSDVQIALILRRKRLRTPTGLVFTASRVAGLRNKHGIAPGLAVPVKGENIYTAFEAGRILGVDRGSVIRWVEAGLLKGSQVMAGATWRIQLSEEDRQRLTASNVPEGWLPLKRAALALGLSYQSVLQKLKSGELEGVRVRVGGRSAWRIRTLQRTYDDQPSLFAQPT